MEYSDLFSILHLWSKCVFSDGNRLYNIYPAQLPLSNISTIYNSKPILHLQTCKKPRAITIKLNLYHS